MTLLSVLTAPIVAIIATLLMSATAAAAPDLSGKSSLYVSTYKTSYVTCLEKSVGRKDAVAYCEAQAILAAKAAEAKRALVKAPTGPVQNSTPTGPISTAPLPTPLPTDGIREVQEDRRIYSGYDLVFMVPVKITNFRKAGSRPIEMSQPSIKCELVEGPIVTPITPRALSKFLAEGDSYEDVIPIPFHFHNKGELWQDGLKPFSASCVLRQNGETLCGQTAYERDKSFCLVKYNSEGNKYTQHPGL